MHSCETYISVGYSFDVDNYTHKHTLACMLVTLALLFVRKTTFPSYLRRKIIMIKQNSICYAAVVAWSPLVPISFKVVW